MDREGRGPTQTGAGAPFDRAGPVNRTARDIFYPHLGRRLEASVRSRPCAADRASRKEATRSSALVLVLNWSDVNSERQTVRRHHHSTRRNTSW
jgi:hypothetical protein